MPVQSIVGVGLWVIGGHVEEWLNQVSTCSNSVIMADE